MKQFTNQLAGAGKSDAVRIHIGQGFISPTLRDHFDRQAVGDTDTHWAHFQRPSTKQTGSSVRNSEKPLGQPQWRRANSAEFGDGLIHPVVTRNHQQKQR